MREIIINKNDSGQRLDKFMNKRFPDMPQSLLYKYIRKKCVKLNGKHIKESEKLNEGDILKLYISEEFFEKKKQEAFIPIKADLNIIYEDENIILVNKPAGLVVHKDETNSGDTLIDRIQSYLYNKGEYNPKEENTFAPSLANRIDRNTQGIVIGAKNAQTLRVLNEKIKNREIKKRYLCLAFGKFEKINDILSGYLERKDKSVKIFNKPSDKTKEIKTGYRILSYRDGISLAEINLITGRTHQIRAHLAHIGHPLVGDEKYGDRNKNKTFDYKYQALCSYKLSFKFSSNAGILEYLNNQSFIIKDIDFVKKFGYKL